MRRPYERHPSPRQWPTPTATIWAGITSVSVSRPDISWKDQRTAGYAQRSKRQCYGNCASLRCPKDVPTARTGTFRCADRKATSSPVATAAPVAAV